MQRFFIFIRTTPGRANEVGVALAKSKSQHIKDISSISGKWDLLLRVEIDNRRDVSEDVIAKLFDVDHIRRTKTEVGYAVFDPGDYTLDDDFG
jgi:hypothetical protein